MLSLKTAKLLNYMSDSIERKLARASTRLPEAQSPSDADSSIERSVLQLSLATPQVAAASS